MGAPLFTNPLFENALFENPLFAGEPDGGGGDTGTDPIVWPHNYVLLSGDQCAPTQEQAFAHLSNVGSTDVCMAVWTAARGTLTTSVSSSTVVSRDPALVTVDSVARVTLPVVIGGVTYGDGGIRFRLRNVKAGGERVRVFFNLAFDPTGSEQFSAFVTRGRPVYVTAGRCG